MNRSPSLSVPSCTSTERDRTAAAIELRLEHGALRVARRIRLEIREVGDEQDHLEQLIEILPLPRRHLDGDGGAAPRLRHQAEVGELALDALGVGVRLVDLVDRDDDRHVGRLRVVDRFPGLRHDAVVGGDDEDDDVGDPRAARAHHRERFVARRVEEHHAAAVDLDRVRADVLRDAAGFALGDLRLADRVEQRRLAVVDVAHDRDDGRARLQVFRLRRFGLHLDQLLLEAAHQHLRAKVARDRLRRFGVERRVDRHHHAAIDQLLEDVLHLHVQLVGEVAAPSCPRRA